MVRRIYDIEPYRRKIMEASLEWMPQHSSLSKRLNYLGFKSCRFVLSKNDYWEMDDIEYTWFVLRFS